MPSAELCKIGRLRSTAERAVRGAFLVASGLRALLTGACFSSNITPELLNFRAQSATVSPALDLRDRSEPRAVSIRTTERFGRSVDTAHISGVIPRTSC